MEGGEGMSSRGGVNNGHWRLQSSDSLIPGLNNDVALNCLARVSRSDYASLSCVNKTFHRLMVSGYLYDLRKRLGIIEHWVYMVFDPMLWLACDPVRNKWMILPQMPCDICFTCADKESLAVDCELLVFGQEISGFAIWKYSLIHHSWFKCEGMNHPCCLFGSASCGSIGIVAGGCDKSGNALQTAELYDSTTGKWKILPKMHSPRKMCSGFFMDDKFYVIGGISGLNVSLTCGEEYDLKTKKWRKIEGMYPNVASDGQAPPLIAAVDNQLYAVENSTNMVKKYDKVKNTWDVMGRLPIRADVSNGWGLAFKACGDKLLVVGGQRSLGPGSVVLNTWCPKSGVTNGILDWKVVGMRERVGVFVYNCAIMGC